MSATTVSSSYITNPVAQPQVKDPLGSDGRAKLRVIMGTVDVPTTSIDDIGDATLLFKVKGNERLVSLLLFNDDMDSNVSPLLAVNVGLYKNVSKAGDSATAVDADCYAAESTVLQAAVTAGTELRAVARNISKIGQTIAADGGESEHSDERAVGIAVSAAAATAVAGTVSWIAVVAGP